MSGTMANVSPVRRWVASGDVLPEVAEHGLSGMCPAMKLPLVNLTKVPDKMKNDYRSLFVGDQGYTLVHFFGVVQKMSSSMITQKRVIVVGPRALHLLYYDRNVARCIAIEDIQHVYHSHDAWVGINVVSEHSLGMRFENKPQTNDFIRIVSKLYEHIVKSEMKVTLCHGGRDAVKAKLKLSKDPTWRAQDFMVKFTSVTTEQIRQAQRDVASSYRRALSPSLGHSPHAVPMLPPHHPSPQSEIRTYRSVSVMESPVKAPAPPPAVAQPQMQTVSSVDSVDQPKTLPDENTPSVAPLSPRTQQRVDDRRRALEHKLHRLHQEEEGLRVRLHEQEDTLEQCIAASFANSLDRKRICDLLSLDHPPDCRCEVTPDGRLAFPVPYGTPQPDEALSPPPFSTPTRNQDIDTASDVATGAGIEDLVYKEPLLAAIREKVGQVAKMRDAWLRDSDLVATEVEQVERDTAEAGLDEVRQELLECYSTRVGPAEELKETEVESRALVEKVAAIAEETASITSRIRHAPQAHADAVAALSAHYASREKQLQDEAHRIKTEPRLATDADQTLLDELAELESGCAQADAELRALREEEAASEAKAREKGGADVIGDELRDACSQLRAALQRISELQEEADATPSLIQDLESRESEMQRLDFESRELVIKSTQMKKEFEAHMVQLAVERDALDLKIRQLQDLALEQEQHARRDIREAKLRIEQEAGRMAAAENEEKAKLLQAQRSAKDTDEQLDHYYSTCLSSPFSRKGTEGELEARLAIVDDTVDSVQRELQLLSERDAKVREKFARSEAQMVHQETGLMRKLAEQKESGRDSSQTDDDLAKVRNALHCLQDSMDTFSVQARATRSRHHQRERSLLTRRDELIESLRECSVSTMIDLTLPTVSPTRSVTAPHTPLSPPAPLPPAPPALMPIIVTRHPGEKWGLSCEGKCISMVIPGSPVCRAGLRVGQTVVSVNGLPVTHRKQIYSEFCSREAEAEVVVMD